MVKHVVEVHAPILMLYIEQNPNQKRNVGNVPTNNSNTRTYPSKMKRKRDFIAY